MKSQSNFSGDVLIYLESAAILGMIRAIPEEPIFVHIQIPIDKIKYYLYFLNKEMRNDKDT